MEKPRPETSSSNSAPASGAGPRAFLKLRIVFGGESVILGLVGLGVDAGATGATAGAEAKAEVGAEATEVGAEATGVDDSSAGWLICRLAGILIVNWASALKSS